MIYTYEAAERLAKRLASRSGKAVRIYEDAEALGCWRIGKGANERRYEIVQPSLY